MVKIEIKMPEDFLLKLSQLGNQTDTIIPKVLEAGGEVVLAKAKINLSSVVGRNTKVKSCSTGELENALGLSKARQNRKGAWDVKVGFAEPRRGKGDSNAKIANIIEYGRHGQPPKPFMKPAQTQSRNSAVEAMKENFEQEAERI